MDPVALRPVPQCAACGAALPTAGGGRQAQAWTSSAELALSQQAQDVAWLTSSLEQLRSRRRCRSCALSRRLRSFKSVLERKSLRRYQHASLQRLSVSGSYTGVGKRVCLLHKRRRLRVSLGGGESNSLRVGERVLYPRGGCLRRRLAPLGWLLHDGNQARKSLSSGHQSSAK
jgi:hypothetical protein